VIKLWKER